MRGGQAKFPARRGVRITSAERVVEETFAVGFENNTVAIGVFMIGGPAAAQRYDAIGSGPASAGNHDIVRKMGILLRAFGRGTWGGLIKPDKSEGGFHVRRIFRNVLGQRVAMRAGDPGGDRDVARGEGVAKINNIVSGIDLQRGYGEVARRLRWVKAAAFRRHRQSEGVAHRARIINEIAIIDAESAPECFGKHCQMHRGVTPVARAFIVGAIRAIHGGESLGARASEFEP